MPQAYVRPTTLMRMNNSSRMRVDDRLWPVREERLDYDVFLFMSFQEDPHKKLFFDLKDKNYTKAKMKGELG